MEKPNIIDHLKDELDGPNADLIDDNLTFLFIATNQQSLIEFCLEF
jgi:hypothetical protein